MIICAIRMYQIQEKARGAVLSVIPEKMPMVMKGEDMQYSHGVESLYIAGRVDRALDRQDGGFQAGGHQYM